MAATSETNTKYNVMGFKAAAGAPTSGNQASTSTKAEGEGSFYWDTTNHTMYMCIDSDSSDNSGS